jgi:hypothetical protein
VKLHARTRNMLAWSLWLATFGCCAAGLIVTLVVTRPITTAVLAEGALYALVFPLAYGTIGLVLALRRPANPIGWLYAASGLVWAVEVPWQPWVDQLILDHRPLPVAAQVVAVTGEFIWAPAVALGITLPALLVPNGRLRSPRWRVVAIAAVTAATLGPLAAWFSPVETAETPLPIDNPFGCPGRPARSLRWSASPAWWCTRPAFRPRCCVWCCGSGPLAGWSANSSAGSPPVPPSP